MGGGGLTSETEIVAVLPRDFTCIRYLDLNTFFVAFLCISNGNKLFHYPPHELLYTLSPFQEKIIQTWGQVCDMHTGPGLRRSQEPPNYLKVNNLYSIISFFTYITRINSTSLKLQLIQLYYEVVQNKFALEGKDSGSMEFIDPTTFTRYKGYIQVGLQIESSYTRRCSLHHAPTQPEMIFIPILQRHHWHLLVVNFDGKAHTTITGKQRRGTRLRLIEWYAFEYIFFKILSMK